MSLEITFLGTGGAFCDFRENYHNNALIKTDTGYILIDCGGTAVQSLKELGIPLSDIELVIITHCHGDHIGGLEQLMWERYYLHGWLRTPIYSTERILKDVRKSLWACMDEFTNMDGVQANGYDVLADPRVPETALNIGDLSIALKKTPHVQGGDGVDKPCYGVWIRKGPTGGEGFIAYYTSDTTFRPDIDVLFPEVDVFFHDCTFTPHYPGTVHTHYSELLTLPAHVRCQTVLMHHTKIPAEIEVGRDGFRSAAHRHDRYFDGVKLHP